MVLHLGCCCLRTHVHVFCDVVSVGAVHREAIATVCCIGRKWLFVVHESTVHGSFNPALSVCITCQSNAVFHARTKSQCSLSYNYCVSCSSTSEICLSVEHSRVPIDLLVDVLQAQLFWVQVHFFAILEFYLEGARLLACLGQKLCAELDIPEGRRTELRDEDATDLSPC